MTAKKEANPGTDVAKTQQQVYLTFNKILYVI